MSELLIGCGNSRIKQFGLPGDPKGFSDLLVTLDVSPKCEPQIIWDLRDLPLPFPDNAFTELHAYEVLEHIGRQGDHVLFFEQFTEFWRILRPGGKLYATVPDYRSVWAWGDPQHSRIINHGSLVFLDQQEYLKQVGKTNMSDYRDGYHGDFRPLLTQYRDDKFYFVIEARK